MAYAILRTNPNTLARLRRLASVAHLPLNGAPPPPPARSTTRTRDARMMDAKARDEQMRDAENRQLRAMNEANRRFWRDAAAVHNSPPGDLALRMEAIGAPSRFDTGAPRFDHAAGPTGLAFAHPGDPIPDKSRKGSYGELSLAAMNAHSHHFWNLPEHRRADFSRAVTEAARSGRDISPEAVGEIAKQFMAR